MSEAQHRATLRKQLRQRRQALTAAYRDAAADLLASRIVELDGWQKARSVGGYWPNDGEMDPRPLLQLARNAGKRVCLPVLAEGNTLTFREWDMGAELVGNRFGIPEPPAATPDMPLTELDIVLMPLVGWSRDGTRLGMGGGFYDRSLAGNHDTIRVGLAFDCQEADTLQAAAWDVPLDYVLTETALHRCSREQSLPGHSD